MTEHKIADIGDGISKRACRKAYPVLEAVGGKFGIRFRWDDLTWSC